MPTGTPGNDNMVGGTGPETIEGFGGFDTIHGGDGNDSIDGGADSDNLYGEGGNDTLRGGSETDILVGGAGNDLLDGGDGWGDTVHYWYAIAGVTVNLVTGLATGGDGNDTIVGVEDIDGSTFGDTLIGTAGTNELFGWIGHDSLFGGDGFDFLQGGADNDTLDGGAGIDWAYYFNAISGVSVNLQTGSASGGDGNDSLTGIENVTGSGHSDVLTGDGAANYLSGYDGNDALYGGIGDDTLGGDNGNDLIDGGAGNDTAWVHGNAAAVINLVTGTVTSSAGNDTLVGIENAGGTDFDDVITGDSGDNRLYGSKGDDIIVGGGGNDWLDGGSHYIDGDEFDTVSYAGVNGAVFVNLGGGVVTGAAGNDTLHQFEAVIGSAFDDELQGDSGDNSLSGGAGSDFIWAGAGNDTLRGDGGDDDMTAGLGDDLVDGGSGNDMASWEDATSAVAVNLATNLATGGGGNDTLVSIENVIGSTFNDTLTGDANDNIFESYGGNDTVDGGGGFDAVYFGSLENGVVVNLANGTSSGEGNDVLTSIEEVQGSDFDDSITGSNAANLLTGNRGSDTLIGGGGNDTLVGSGRGDDDIDTPDDSDVTDVDVARFTGNRSQYTITYDGSTGRTTVVDKQAGRDGTDILIGVEVLQFADQSVQQTSGGSGHIDPSGTYLGTSVQDGPAQLEFVLLSELGLAPGDLVVIAHQGAFQGGPNFADNSTGLLVVFANNANFLAPPVFTGVTSPPQAITGTPTNIAQDFYVSPNGAIVVQIPVGATRILFSAWDGFFSDNTDPNNDFIATVRKLDASTALPGSDQVWGTNGDDDLNAGAGRDTVIGGAGNDNLNGGTIADRIRYLDLNVLTYETAASAVNINLSGLSGDGSSGRGTVLDGDGGVDRVVNFDSILGSAFDDTILGSSADIYEKFYGGAGNDTIDGGAIDPFTQNNSNRVSYFLATGGVTVDLATGTGGGSGQGSDTLININHVFGGAYNDSLAGSASTLVEQFYGSTGNDTIDGRGGIDEARYDAISGGPIHANLATGVVQDGLGGTDTLSNIEGLRGGTGNDTLVGGNAANGTGSTDGFEYFVGDQGNDSIDGGGGYDRADYRTSSGAVNVTLGGTGSGTAQDGLGGTDTLVNIEAVRGSEFADTLTGSDTGVFESFEGRKGNDTIDGKGGTDRADYNFADGAVTVNLATQSASGASGNDTLLNIEQVRGSSFDDSITGDAAANRLDGGLGNDTVAGGAGDDTFVGSAGVDWVTYAAAGAGVNVTKAQNGVTAGTGTDGSGGTDTIEQGAADVLVGSGFNDTLTGAPEYFSGTSFGRDEIHGGGGADSVSGLGGEDLLYGENGNDTLAGGDGDDDLQGDAGDDRLDGGNGLDAAVYVTASSGVNANLQTGLVSGGAGNDTLIGIEAVIGSTFGDTLTGSAGADSIMGRQGNDVLSGGGGFDMAFYTEAGGAVVVSLLGGSASGGDGNDTLSGIEGAVGSQSHDTLTGDEAANRLEGEGGHDLLDGRGGDDTLFGGAGNDTLVGGDGTDTAFFAFDYAQYRLLTGSVPTDLAVEGAEGDDILRGIEILQFADRMVALVKLTQQADAYSVNANAGAVIVDAGGGNDVITANNSGNALLGGEGNDQLQGGTGDDNLDGGTGTDVMTGGDGDDIYVVDSAGDVVVETSNPVQGTGPGQPQDIDLSRGDRVLASLSHVLEPLVEHLTLAGQRGDINATGNGLANHLVGNEGRNAFDGKGGDDSIAGGAGNDTLIGGAGNDTMDGGAGFDIVRYTGNFNSYAVSRVDGGVSITGPDGIDLVSNAERILFADFGIAFDIDGNAGKAYRLYQAAFDRTPDIGGLGFQMNALDIGFSLLDISGDFIRSPEFQTTYGALSNVDFVTLLYANVLDRDPDADGLAFHVNRLEIGVPRAGILEGFSESPENKVNVLGAIENGMVYVLA